MIVNIPVMFHVCVFQKFSSMRYTIIHCKCISLKNSILVFIGMARHKTPDDGYGFMIVAFILFESRTTKF